MNLIEENFQNKEEKKKKRTTKIILSAIILVVIVIIAIVGYLMYLQSTVMTLTLDGQSNEKLKKLLVFRNDGIYAPIKEIASYFGYESYNGEYSEKSEQKSKCYVINESEVVNFELGQNKLYRLDLTQKDANNYEYTYIKDPIIAIDGVLYISTEGLEEAFNISFQYSPEQNEIVIWTMPYLYQSYVNKVLDYGFVELSSEFVNQKAILKNQLIVLKDGGKKQYGVIQTDGQAILEPKYDNITYLPNTGDFLVEVDKKVGILSSNKDTKVQIIYDSIELMDSDAGLYVAQKEGKYGVLDLKGNIKIHIENDEIGIDNSKFTQNNIKNKYILADNLIPVRKDKYWGFYDKSGNQLTEYKYDSLGYIASSSKDAINLLVIPNYNVLVACKDKKYTLVNTIGKELFATVADDIYMRISGGEKHYYITVNDQIMDAEEWLNKNGITAKQTENTNEQSSSNTENQQGNNNEKQSNNNEEGQQNGNNEEQSNNNEEEPQENNNEEQSDNNEEGQQENNNEEQSNNNEE